MTPNEGKNFYRFICGLMEAERCLFLNALTEQEKVDYSGSREEFRLVMEREPLIEWPPGKPDFEEDVRMPAVKTSDIEKRYAKLKVLFPKNINDIAYKNDILPAERPEVNVTIQMVHMDNVPRPPKGGMKPLDKMTKLKKKAYG